MKIIVVILLGLGIYLVFSTQIVEPPKPPIAESPTPLEIPAAPISSVPRPFVASSPPPVAIPDLVVIRGSVSTRSADGLIVECKNETISAQSQMLASHLPANAGAADTARLAKLAMQLEEKPYGPLMEARNGRLHYADVVPEATAEGVILLRDHPNEKSILPDQRFKIVAVPTGDVYEFNGRSIQVYTMAYTLTPEASRAWMWIEKESTLDRRRR